MALYLAEHCDDEKLRAMGVRLPPAVPTPPKRIAPVARRSGRTSGAAEVYGSADEVPAHFKQAAAQVRQRDWLRREGTTEAGIRWLTEG